MGRTTRNPSNKHPADVRPEYSLLGFLGRQSMHGYELYGQFQRHLGFVWRLSQSQMYSILKRLEAQGLVEGAGREGPAPSRRPLSITAEGSKRLSAWLEAPSDCSSRIMRLEFISRLFFARARDEALAARIVEEQKAKVGRELANHRSLLEQLGEEDDYNRLSLEFRIRQLEAQMSWLSDDVAPRCPPRDSPSGPPRSTP